MMTKTRRLVEMIFAPDENGESNYTMEKLLPLPDEFSTSTGFSKVGYHWRYSVWGTKWDVIEPVHKLDGFSLVLYYDTAWAPNIPWIETLCEIIEHQQYWEHDDSPVLSIEHNYWEWRINFGGNMLWKPEVEIHYDEYELVEYAYFFNKCLYKWLIETLWYESNNPGWEKFNEQLDEIVNRRN